MPALLDARRNRRAPPAAEIRVAGTDALDDATGARSRSERIGVPRVPPRSGRDQRVRTTSAGTAAATSVDRERMLFLAGRQSDLILRAGENIYPADRGRSRAPDITDVVVVGVPTGSGRSRGLSWRGRAASPRMTFAWAAAALAPFKIPAHVGFRDRLRTAHRR
jgi:acyl-CoA synthetase (AMP-forming)/AMP-acid ligase II